MSGHAVDFARAGAQAIESHFQAAGLNPVTSGDGRFVVYIPGKGEAEDLQLTLASTPASRGILARVKARQSVEPQHWGRALVLINKWNRSCPLPHASLSATGIAATFLLEASLPPSPEYPTVMMARFIDTVVVGARNFWSGAAIRAVVTPWPAGAVGDDAPSIGATEGTPLPAAAAE